VCSTMLNASRRALLGLYGFRNYGLQAGSVGASLTFHIKDSVAREAHGIMVQYILTFCKGNMVTMRSALAL
jgi:hypothetical protein